MSKWQVIKTAFNTYLSRSQYCEWRVFFPVFPTLFCLCFSGTS